jgi:serine/threonine protein kinase
LKICDFGLSKHSSSVAGAVSKLGAGTPAFLAPEIINDGHSSYDSDVFSFAVTIVQVLLRITPNRTVLKKQTSKAFDWSADPEGSDACMVQANSSLHQLCSDMLQAEPSHRPAIYRVSEQLYQIQQLIGGDPRDPDTEDSRITAFRDTAIVQQKKIISALKSAAANNTSSSTTEVDSYFLPSSVSSQSIGKLPLNISYSLCEEHEEVLKYVCLEPQCQFCFCCKECFSSSENHNKHKKQLRSKFTASDSANNTLDKEVSYFKVNSFVYSLLFLLL